MKLSEKANIKEWVKGALEAYRRTRGLQLHPQGPGFFQSPGFFRSNSAVMVALGELFQSKKFKQEQDPDKLYELILSAILPIITGQELSRYTSLDELHLRMQEVMDKIKNGKCYNHKFGPNLHSSRKNAYVVWLENFWAPLQSCIEEVPRRSTSRSPARSARLPESPAGSVSPAISVAASAAPSAAFSVKSFLSAAGSDVGGERVTIGGKSVTVSQLGQLLINTFKLDKRLDAYHTLSGIFDTRFRSLNFEKDPVFKIYTQLVREETTLGL